jgi:hypothetical protein
MARKLLRQTVTTIVTPLALTAALFFGIGLWRQSQDANWCRHATSSGVVAGDQPVTSDLLEQVRSACTVHRERQRVMFGAVWRRGGQETAQCGFELARLQLTSYEDPNGHGAILKRYGIDDAAFDASNREDQDRFINACLFNRDREAG